jgi:hypothetical protein
MIAFRIVFVLLVTFLIFGQVNSQCTSGLTSVTSAGSSQRINDINVAISSPTNAQAKRVASYGSISGYHIGDDESTEEILFSLNRPVTQIRIIGRALSAPNNNVHYVEYFTLEINGERYNIQPSELITPDPVSGTECFLQDNGSILGNTSDGNGSFIFTYTSLVNDPGIISFKVKDSITNLNPGGVILDVQIYSKCRPDTGTGTTVNTFFFLLRLHLTKMEKTIFLSLSLQEI